MSSTPKAPDLEPLGVILLGDFADDAALLAANERANSASLTLIVGVPGHGSSYAATTNAMAWKDDVIIYDTTPTIEESIVNVIKLVQRDECVPVTIRHNYAQQQGDTWRRNGKRKGRRGR